MSKPALPHPLRVDPETGEPMAPPLAEWLQLTEAERERTTFALIDAYSAWERETQPPEGTPHARAQRDLFDRLSQHLEHTRKGVFLATNLMVQYPEGTAFAPDLIAVLDVPLHDRSSWVVANEGKGPDLAVEFLHRGDRQKDMKRNVVRFAAMGIQEYFVFDGERRGLHGWRLPETGATTYAPIVPQFGFWSCGVLGVEFAVREGQLRVFHHGADVLGSADRISLLGQLVNDAQTNAEAEAQRVEVALQAQRDTLRAICAAKGWVLDAQQTVQIDACDDATVLGRWTTRAALGTALAEVFDEAT
jgi:Uma2 family endonuclease